MWLELDGHSTTAALSLVSGAITIWHVWHVHIKESCGQKWEQCVCLWLVVGEEPFSFGYGGTGKKSENCKFADFGEKFGENDVIGCYIVSNGSYNWIP